MPETNSAENVVDVLVVGGGMVGSALALALANDGARVVLLDAGERPSALPDTCPASVDAVGARVSAINSASQQLLSRLGVWERLGQQRVARWQAMQVWDAEGAGSVTFAADDFNLACLGYLVENDALVLASLQALDASPATCFAGARLADVQREGDRWRVSFIDAGGKRQQLVAALLVGADGAQSTVREALKIPHSAVNYGQRAIVCTLRSEKSHGFCARQVFLPSGPLALLPLADPHLCSVVWSARADDGGAFSAAALLALDDAAFCRRLAQASEWQLGHAVSVSRRHAFPLIARNALHYVQVGAALLGDAAHNIHPLAGQGVNLGYADVESFVRHYQRACAASVAPGDLRVLRAFARERRPRAMLTSGGMTAFHHVFGSESLTLRWARNIGMDMVDGQPWLKKAFLTHASGVSLTAQGAVR